MEDLIKRSDAISKAFCSSIDGVPRMVVLLDDIKAIPSADRPSGEWMPNPKIGWGETWVCSVCGEKTTSTVMGYPRYNFCPMCGARMKGADDE